jgi:hypothetical protein
MTKARTVAVCAGMIAGTFFLTACATVEPWQRSRLANPCMVFDSNGAQLSFDTHWQTSREGAAGGFGIQGGGCGCK